MKKRWVNSDEGRIRGFKEEIARVCMKWNFSMCCKDGTLIVEQYNEDHIIK